MIPQFKVSDIETKLIAFSVNNENKFIDALTRVGDEFVAKARSTDTYNNQTFNLRSSIGYVISNNGSIIKSNYEQFGNAGLGVSTGLNLAKEVVATEQSKGIVLIVTAGMNYALYVEAMGYDVLTGSIPNKSQVLDSFKQMINE